MSGPIRFRARLTVRTRDGRRRVSETRSSWLLERRGDRLVVADTGVLIAGAARDLMAHHRYAWHRLAFGAASRAFHEYALLGPDGLAYRVDEEEVVCIGPAAPEVAEREAAVPRLPPGPGLTP